MRPCLRKRLMSGENAFGTWCSLSSPLTAEIAGLVGFDWALLDQEHGPGDNWNLLHQIQALGAFETLPIVRLASHESWLVKRALDLGAGGIMFPFVQSRQEAEQLVQSMYYPPLGTRGLAAGARCAGFGARFAEYRQRSAEELLCVVQIETATAVEAASAIAAVDGVDVLFVGPLDLSADMKTPNQFDDSSFVEALSRVASSARAKGKAAGILVPSMQWARLVRSLGYTFIAVGGDAGAVMQVFTATVHDLQAVGQ